MRKAEVVLAAVAKGVLAFIVVVVFVYAMGTIVQCLFVLAALKSAGAQIPLSVIPRVVWHDLTHQSFYAEGVLVGFGVALPTAALLCRFSKLSQSWVYPLAGATALAVMLHIFNSNFYGLTFFAGTRGWSGFLSQLAVGAVGGRLFAAVRAQWP